MNQFLVDTSVLSEALRRKKNSINSSDTLVKKIIEQKDEIVLIGIILQEILTGISDKKLYLEIKEILSDFSYLEIKKEDYIFASEIRNLSKQNGITISSFDAIIASIAIHHKITLVSFDKDFKLISKLFDLKILDIEKYLKKK